MSKSDELPFELTLHVRDHCLCMHVRRASRALARRYDEALRPAGLTNGQFSLMMSLNRPAPPAMGDVAALLAMNRATLTASLKPLERRGLVAVAVDNTDRRSRRLSLTEAGRKVLAVAVPIWKRAQAENESLVQDIEPDRVRGVLRALS